MSILACILAGLASACAYASLAHLVAGLRQSFSAVHLIFALLAMLVAGHALAHIGVYSAPNVTEYLAASRWSNTLGVAAMATLPWFAYAYAAARIRWIPTALSAFYVLVIVAYELTPMGSVMRAPPELTTLILPWGERATMHVLPRLPTALLVFWLITLATVAYMYVLCVRQYRRGQRLHAVVFGASLAMLPLALVANMFILLGKLHWLFVGEFGFISLVLVMTLYLSSDESYRALVAQASDGIFLATPSGRYVDVNPAGLRMLGYRFEEMRRLQITDVVHPEEQSRVAVEAAALNDGATMRSEWRFRRKNGTSLIGEMSAQMLSDGRLLGVVRDITEHARLHTALRLLARLGPAQDATEFSRRCVGALAQAVGAQSALIAMRDEHTATLRSLAVWSGEGLTADFTCLLTDAPIAQLDAHRELNVRAAGDRFPNYPAFGGRSADGYHGLGIVDTDSRLIGIVEVWSADALEIGAESRQILEVFANRIGAEFQRAVALEGLRQLTATLEARVSSRTAELAELNQQLEAFAYTVSHDLRAPVRAVNSFSALLLEGHEGALDEEARHFLCRIRTAGAHMNELIDGLLLLASASHQSLSRERIDLCALADEAIRSLQERDPQRQVDLVFCPEAWVDGDRRLLSVAMTNLLENAWKYSSRTAAARIEFGIHRAKEGTAFFVRDNGVGFDMKYTERLFEPFHRLHSPKEFPGSGIGLATVARVLQRHGGRIWAQSAPGEGATFFFTVPQADAGMQNLI